MAVFVKGAADTRTPHRGFTGAPPPGDLSTSAPEAEERHRRAPSRPADGSASSELEGSSGAPLAPALGLLLEDRFGTGSLVTSRSDEVPSRQCSECHAGAAPSAPEGRAPFAPL